ncbi:hypothetical protein M9Y10_033526 [Tritrichomonas musculus]|uniref:Uncharacterized protein n=1 Tax=Tritrichomonas musculus TaxID=1915356 RepID=A0ABR2KCD7_9EUKA
MTNKSQAEEQFVDEDELAYELDKYVMKDELPTVDLTPYALKSDIINKYQTKIDIEILGTLRTGFSFKKISIDDLKQGFYFSFYDTTDSSLTLKSNKYSLVSSDGVCIFLSDDEMLRIVFTSASTNTYTMTVYNIPAGN